jgi:hypothetical protein
VRPCGCIADFRVFGHTCEQYGPPRLAAALQKLRLTIARITETTGNTS